MAGYSHRAWACPFFKWDERLRVHCEGGCVQFRDREQAVEYQNGYCASLEGWESCTVAASAVRYYERMDQNAKRGQNQGSGKGAGAIP